MKQLLIVLLTAFAFTSLDVPADEFHTLVRYTCDKKSDHLMIEYLGAYNEEGVELDTRKGYNAWSPGDMRGWRPTDRRFASPKTIRRTCLLSDGKYVVEVGPVPNDFRNVNGMCGAWETAWVRIRKHNQDVLKKLQFDKNCRDTTLNVTTKVIIKPGPNAPVLTEVKWNDFYK